MSPVRTILAAVLFATALSASAQVTTTPDHRNKEAWWAKRHEEKAALAAKGGYDLVFIGDSITQGWEGGGKKAWAAKYEPRKALNLGFSGDRTEHVLWRLDNGELPDALQPKAFVIMIGTNNTGHRMDKPEDIAAGIKAIVAKLRERRPSAKILLLGVFPRGEKPDDRMRVNNAKVNELVAGTEGVEFLDIGAKFLTAEGILAKEVMPDRLHLNEASYGTWAEAIEPAVARLLGETK